MLGALTSGDVSGQRPSLARGLYSSLESQQVGPRNSWDLSRAGPENRQHCGHGGRCLHQRSGPVLGPLTRGWRWLRR